MKVYFTSEPNRARQCTVDWISPVLDPATHAVKIRGLIDNSDGRLLSDMYGTMSITVSDGKNSLLLTPDAIVHEHNEAHPERENQAFVFVQVGKALGKAQYRKTPVTVVPLQAGFGVSQPSASASRVASSTESQTRPSVLVCISQGIHAGDSVVVSGTEGLSNEMTELANTRQGSIPPAGASGSSQASLSMKQ
jgi:multidrug efflux pump subunit AcrA (membrane-fusion protein)